MRSTGFHSNDGNTQDFRTVPIHYYYPMINMINKRGGYVILMGDSSFPKVDKSDLQYPNQCIEYAHLSEKSSALDIALSGSCKLFVSSPSGLHTIAKAFGRPRLFTNFCY